MTNRTLLTYALLLLVSPLLLCCGGLLLFLKIWGISIRDLHEGGEA